MISSNKESILEEIEALNATLTQTEFQITKPFDDQLNQAEILIQIVPDSLQYSFTAKNSQIIIQNLPRLILRITLSAHNYPSTAAPVFGVEGFWVNKAFTIYQRLENRFEPQNQVLFDWYSFCKEQLFFTETGQLDPFFFETGTEFNCDGTRLKLLEDEVYETKLLKASMEGIDCEVCLTQVIEREEMHIFKNCLHAFCKRCIREDASSSITSGDLQKIKCPAMIKNKRCLTFVTEIDLAAVGVPQELIQKMVTFSISQAIDSMDDYGWCPIPQCQAPAEIDKVKMFGQCGQCWLQFCTKCRKKYHPFKRCEITKISETQEMTKEKLIELQNEAKTLVYLKFCSKSCPNCNFPISKTEGCNKMQCSRCTTMFCWSCLEILPYDNPYSHFKIEGSCWDINAARIADELNRPATEEEEVKNYVQKNSTQWMQNCARCPQCSEVIERGRQKINQIACQKCMIEFCFMCATQLKNKQQATEHFEISNCYYQDIS